MIGSGTTGYRTALPWATVTTMLGSLLALLLARGLIAAFRGKGLVPEALTADPAFLLSVSVAAALTVLLATRLGLPVSTTHALIGGLVGAGAVATHGHLDLARLGATFVLPLLLSPLLALGLTVVLYGALARLRRGLGIARTSCLCAGEALLALSPAGAAALSATPISVTTG
ncbi:MAG: inorganic phosphate transporter, partial [Gemmatimonadales bacterium]|nr:inorganic phosphate transporter [Gemmatimonadales bacterium]